MQRLIVAAGALLAAATLGAPWSPVAAQTPSLAAGSPCGFGFAATAVPSDQNAATVRLNYAAAMRSDFSPETFRCITVPSVYVFVVDYMP